MFVHISRLVTLLGAGMAAILAAEIFIGERASFIAEPELRALDLPEEERRAIANSNYCAIYDCVGPKIRSAPQALRRTPAPAGGQPLSPREAAGVAVMFGAEWTRR